MNDNEIPVLWTFRRCPYAMRTRLAIKSSGTQVYLREIVLRNKPDEFICDSAKATVPVLKLSNGKIIEESIEIMYWALTQNDPNNWCGVLNARQEHSRNFLAKLDGQFKNNLDRYKYASRYGLGADESVKYRKEGSKFLSRVNDLLKETSFLSGESQGFLDIASLPFVRQFRIANPEWFDQQDWPQLHNWLQTFLASNQFSLIMEKLKPWDSKQGQGVLF
ncbi:MAG: glutathione S-transferase [Burkholderiales bacterium]|nr:glutathione S-transferase [Burkholderiales bacterium]OUT78525.1 MAG: glutathione S-transferase [Betaproteobacteria bacterium TMED22]